MPAKPKPPAKTLVMGVDCPETSQEEQNRRIEVLRTTVQQYLPEFAVAVTTVALSQGTEKKIKTLLLHQDAFAAGYDDDEYTLFGMAIKFAGLLGVEVTIHGTNHETF